MRIPLVAIALLAACAAEPDRAAELAACQLISKSGDALAECLVMKYSWRAESAGPAKTAWQWHLDSIRLEHETQARAVLAEVQRQQDAQLRRQLDSIWRAWEVTSRPGLREIGYDSVVVERFLRGVRRQRRNPEAVDVVAIGFTMLVNMIEQRYDTLGSCAHDVGQYFENLFVTREKVRIAQEIVCKAA